MSPKSRILTVGPGALPDDIYRRDLLQNLRSSGFGAGAIFLGDRPIIDFNLRLQRYVNPRL